MKNYEFVLFFFGAVLHFLGAGLVIAWIFAPLTALFVTGVVIAGVGVSLEVAGMWDMCELINITIIYTGGKK